MDEIAGELGASDDSPVLLEHVDGAFNDSREMQGESIAGCGASFGASKALDLGDEPVAQAGTLAFERVYLRRVYLHARSPRLRRVTRL